MTIDLGQAKINKERAKQWYIEKGSMKPDDAVGNIAMIYMVPCFVAAFWIAEVTGYTPRIKRSIRSLAKFYGYANIINKPDHYPEDILKDPVLGFQEGDECNRGDCEGIIKRSKVENCHCHVNPPCGNCTDPSLEYCPKCDWDGSME